MGVASNTTRSQSLAGNFQIFWLLQSFSPIFHSDSSALDAGVWNIFSLGLGFITLQLNWLPLFVTKEVSMMKRENNNYLCLRLL